MAIDTPAKLGIIGAGPVGLEACLYARFLGYEVILFESATAAHRLDLKEKLGSFGDFSSSLGRAAIAAQNPDKPLPLLTENLTLNEWRARYLLPLAECDLVVDCLRQNTTVARVSKEHFETEQVTGFDRGGYDFLIETIEADGAKKTETVDALIDASGWNENTENGNAFFNYELSLDLKTADASQFPPTCTDYADELPDGAKLTPTAKSLVLHEPNFYILGEKMLGEALLREKRRSAGSLPYSKILDQIRAVFTILGDRPTLDLYATAVNLPQ